MALTIPECLPDRMSLVVRVIEWSILFDDIIDALPDEVYSDLFLAHCL